MPFFVYILRNPAGRYYIGQTSNVQLRLQRHNTGRVFWTKHHRPWHLVHSEQFETRSKPMAQERQLKGFISKLAVEEYVAKR